MRNLAIRRLTLTLMLFILILSGASARMQRQNIYIFDCTGSMIRPNNIWEPAKRALDGTLSSQSAGDARIVVVPFGDVPYQTFKFPGNRYQSNRKDVFEAFEKNIKEARYTNITDALETGLRAVDPACMTNIYLMTDGNPSGKDTKERVMERINRWCGEKHPNTRLFYVVFSQSAKVPEIMNAVSVCPDAFVVECTDGRIPQLFDIDNEINANIEELDRTYPLDCGLPAACKLTASCGDPYFDVRVVEDPDKGNASSAVRLKFTPREGYDAAALHAALSGKTDGEGIYHFNINVQAAESDIRIANPTVRVNMADHLQTTLALWGGDREPEAEEAVWHDSFLWSPASPNGTSMTDLRPQFRNETADTRYRVRLDPANGEPRDFRYFFNGKEVAPDGSFDIVPGQPAVIRIEYDTDAETGNRHFVLTDCGSRGLDIVNGAPVDDNASGLRSKYSVRMNPLKLAFIITGCVLLGLLLLWFLVLKQVFFRTIKAKRMILTGPAGYYQNKKVKGARKVVMTAGKEKQGMLSRAFTGPVIYVRGDFFTPHVEAVPGTRKKIRLRPSEGWEYDPTSMPAPYESTVMTKGNTAVTLELQ